MTRRPFLLLAGLAGLLTAILMIWLGRPSISEEASAGDNGDAQSEPQTRPAAAGNFQVLSETLTATGRVYVVTRDGLTRTSIIPAFVEFTPEQLEDFSFGTLKADGPPVPQDWSGMNRHLFFYGLVVDGETNVIQGARVEAILTLIGPDQPRAEKVVQIQTDADGRFSVDAAWGQKLRLRVGKEGYIASPWQDFFYARLNFGPLHQPDISNPIWFVLYEDIETPSLLYLERNYRAPNDGTPVRVDLATGEIVQHGGDIVVSIYCPEPYTNLKPFPWRLAVEVPDGGMVRVSDTRFENLHQAPRGGYQPGFAVAYGPDSQEYSRQHDGMYYLASRNGQVFSKLRLTVRTRWDERGVSFSLEAYINTNASRNLRSQHLWKGRPM